jgi:hypothetical protein
MRHGSGSAQICFRARCLVVSPRDHRIRGSQDGLYILLRFVMYRPLLCFTLAIGGHDEPKKDPVLNKLPWHANRCSTADLGCRASPPAGGQIPMFIG